METDQSDWMRFGRQPIKLDTTETPFTAELAKIPNPGSKKIILHQIQKRFGLFIQSTNFPAEQKQMWW